MNNTKTCLQVQAKHFSNSEARAEVLEQNQQQQITQKPPIPLQKEVIKPKPFPFYALGPILSAAAKRMHEVVQAPDGTCGQSVLSALSLACQAFVDVEIEERIYPTSLYLITISDSGERKSAADKLALKPIYEWQKMLVKQYRKQFCEYKNKLDLWKIKRSQALQNSVSCEDRIFIENEPRQPCEGLIICDEPTLEGLEQLLEKGQPSVGIFSDEGGRLVGGYAMNSDNALKTACGLSNLWDGKPLTRVRKGDGSKIIYGRRFAMHIMMQPVVLEKIIGNQLLLGQGILARCLFSAPFPLAGTRTYQEINLSNDPAIIAYYDLINSILNRPYPKQENDNGNDNDFTPGDILEPTRMVLNLDAKQQWIKFHNDTDKKMAKGQQFDPIKPFASKAAEQVLRIAAIFAFSEQLSTFDIQTKISLDHIERAICLVEYYLSEALRIIGCSIIDPNVALAIQVIKWLKRSKCGKSFTITEVRQSGPGEVRNIEATRKIMKLLEDHNQIIPVQSGSQHTWRLNDNEEC